LAALITTNWDDMLERALDSINKDYITVVADSTVPFMGAHQTPVIKLHGTLAQPETIVVTEKDHYDLFALRPGTTTLLESYFATKTLLFVGYSLADSDFKRLYHTCTARFGPLRRRAYAVQLAPTATTVAIWEEQQLEILDSNATDFISMLSSSVI
jgi:hypothetical protein